MSHKTYVTYDGTLPGAAEEVVFVSSTTFFGPRAAPHARCYWVDVAIQADNDDGAPTLELQKSNDGGVTWITVGTPTVINDGHTLNFFFVNPYADWRIVFTNGTTPQASFYVDLVIDHTSRDLPS